MFASNDAKGYAKHLQIHQEDLELDVEVAELNPDLQEEDSEIYQATGSGGSSAKSTLLKNMPPPKGKLTTARLEQQTENRLGGLKADMIKTGEIGEMDDPEPAPVTGADKELTLDDI